MQYVKLILITLIAVLSSYANLGKGAQEGELEQGMVNPGYQEQLEWFKHSFLDLREDIEEATAADKRLMLYFYQDGCPYCKKLLQDNFGQREVVQKTRQYFGLIAINMWGDREVVDLQGNVTSEKRFASALDVKYAPSLVFFDQDGREVFRTEAYLKAFHIQSVLNYVASKAYLKEPEFQRYIEERAARLRASGVEVNLME